MKKRILNYILILFIGISGAIVFSACGQQPEPQPFRVSGEATEGLYYTSDTDFKNGGEVVAFTEDGVPIYTATIRKEMISGVFNNEPGLHYATITYLGLTGRYYYNVLQDNVASTQLEGYIKLEYDNLDTDFEIGSDLVLVVNYQSGNVRRIPVTKEMFNPFYQYVGENVSSIVTEDIVFNFTYTVKRWQPLNIKIHTAPKTEYKDTDISFDLTGAKILAYDVEGGTKQQIINVDSSMVSSFDKTVGTHTATITYSGKTCTFNYTVQEASVVLSRIAITSTFKTNYYSSDTGFDLTGGYITAFYSNGTTEIVKVSGSSVSVTGWNNTAGENKTGTIAYKGKTCVFYYNVSEVPEVILTHIAISSPFRTNYYTSNTGFDLTGGKITAYYSDGTSQVINLNDSSVEVIGWSNVIGDDRIGAICYKNQIVNFTYSVELKAVTSITLVNGIRNNYLTLETAFEVPAADTDVTLATTPKVKIEYNDGEIEYQLIRKNWIQSAFNRQKGTHIATMGANLNGYAFSTQFTYTVNNGAEVGYVTAIENINLKNEYYDTETGYAAATGTTPTMKVTFTVPYQDATGNREKVIEINNLPIDVSATSTMITPINLSNLGENTAYITYGNKTVEFNYTVLENSVESIQVYTSPKDSYYESDTAFDLTGGKILVEYLDGSSEIVDILSSMVASQFNNTAGIHTATIQYKGCECTFSYQVSRVLVENAYLKTEFVLTYYETATDFDITGGQIQVTYNDGTTKVINITKDMLLDEFNNEVGSHSVRIKYDGTNIKYVTYEVLANSVSSIEVASLPKQTYWTSDTEFDFTNGTIKVNYLDGSNEIISMQGLNMAGLYNGVGTHSCTIMYEGKYCSFLYTVVKPEIVGIAINSAITTEYTVFDSQFDYATGTINVSYQDGTIEVKAVTSSMLSEFDDTAGTHTGTITYEGFSDNFIYNVAPAYKVYKQATNSSVYTEYSTYNFVEGEEFNITVEISDNYIITKLEYVEVEVVDNVVTETGERIKIYNNRITMPASDIKIICEARKKTQEATIINLSLGVDQWWYDNCELTGAYFELRDNDGTSSYLSKGNLSYTGKADTPGAFTGINNWNFTQDREVFYITDYKFTTSSMAIYMNFNANDRYQTVSQSAMDKNSSTSPNTLIGTSGICTLEQSVKFSFVVMDLTLNTTKTIEMNYTFRASFNIRNEYSVTFITDDEQIENQILRENDLITNPGGTWYTDKECTQVWNFNDGITEDLILYKG